jgi:hypothetical protein
MYSERNSQKSLKENSGNGKSEPSNQPENKLDTGETSVPFGIKIRRAQFFPASSQNPLPRCSESVLGW